MALNYKLLAAATVLVVSWPSFAGEITGNGSPTPIASGVASSICAFSGRNDTPGQDGFGAVQSYGQLVRSMGGFPPDFFLHPGNACRG